MTPSGAITLIRLSLRRDPRAALSSIFGVSVGVGALTFFLALGLGISHLVKTQIFPVDLTLIEVIPARLDLGLFGGGKLDEGAVAQLKALPGVQRAYRKMNVRVPAVTIYDGDFFGRRLRMGLEVLVVGADPEFLQHDITLGRFEDAPEGPIPAVVSKRLLEIYNKSFASARGLPQLGPSMLVGFTFPIDFNRSYVTANKGGPVTSATAQVVGLSDRGLLAGITVPLDTARRLNRLSGADDATYTALVLEAASPSDVPALVQRVKELGFSVDEAERRLAEHVGAAVAITTSALALLSVLICLLAGFNISHALAASVRARSKELAIFRGVGATRLDIGALVLGEAAVLGLGGGLFGLLAARLCAMGIDRLAATALPEFPFKPDTFFSWPAWLSLLGALIGLVAALLGALGPAARAARVDPARALAG